MRGEQSERVGWGGSRASVWVRGGADGEECNLWVWEGADGGGSATCGEASLGPLKPPRRRTGREGGSGGRLASNPCAEGRGGERGQAFNPGTHRVSSGFGCSCAHGGAGRLMCVRGLLRYPVVQAATRNCSSQQGSGAGAASTPVRIRVGHSSRPRR
eukprot:269871-Chlamydomonas_euryale.AAC.1